ncbi:pentapeptide repeat-containing protein [Yoonia sp. GPGPB17]|uniref:pentapeptide repeat-containing protein n=1 Tax=Yoonia sp. GPGPB17 TaxID=3026147 RepID=UPI0030C634AA
MTKTDENLPTVVEGELVNTSERSKSPKIVEGVAYFTRRIFEDCSISNSTSKDFKHAFLNRASGKGATFSGIDFRYAELTDCYFHGARFENCNFTGAKIRRSNFRTATFENCSFDYLTIEDTPVDYLQVVKNLPDRPNVAQEILHALRRNAVTQGEMKAVRDLTILEVNQEREHLRRAIKGQGEYYRKKYGTFFAKIKLRGRALSLWLGSVLWGHGEKISRLAIACLVSILLLSVFSVGADVLSSPSLTVIEAVSRFVTYTKENFLNLLGALQNPTPSQSVGVDAVIAVLRLIFGGMFVAYIFRTISRR